MSDTPKLMDFRNVPGPVEGTYLMKLVELSVPEVVAWLREQDVLRERTFHAPVEGAGYPRWFETEWEWSDEPWQAVPEKESNE